MKTAATNKSAIDKLTTNVFVIVRSRLLYQTMTQTSKFSRVDIAPITDQLTINGIITAAWTVWASSLVPEDNLVLVVVFSIVWKRNLTKLLESWLCKQWETGCENVKMLFENVLYLLYEQQKAYSCSPWNVPAKLFHIRLAALQYTNWNLLSVPLGGKEAKHQLSPVIILS